MAPFPCLPRFELVRIPMSYLRKSIRALLVGAKPRGAGMERGDLLKENGKIFIEQGKALDKAAKRTVKVVIVGNPCNTNALIALKHAPGLPKENFFAMTRLDENRGAALLAERTATPVREIKNMTIWGNHSSTQVPDFYHAKIAGKRVTDVIEDEGWLKNDFVSRVQKRGAEITNYARGKSSAASAASALIDTLHSLLVPTPPGEWFSAGVYAKNNPYGLEEDLIFSLSLPLQRGGGDGNLSATWN